MAWMAAIGGYATAASTIIGVGSSLGQANAAEQMANIRANQLRKQGIAEKAQAVQVAKYERKKADMMISRATALAAKSGTEVNSVGVQNVLSDIDAQGEYNALAALSSGFSSAQSKDYQAQVEVASGKQAQASGKMAAAGTILSYAENRYG